MTRLRGDGLRDWRAECQVASLGLFAMATISSGGCGYTSGYVPPIDGRARVVWNSQDSEATATLAGGGLSTDCQGAIRQMTGHERIPVDRSFVQLPTLPSTEPYQLVSSYRGEYVPRYYGPNIIVIQPGIAPHFPRPPLFIPGLGRPGFPPPRIAPPIAGGVRIGSGGGRGFGGSSLGGGSGGGDAGKAFVVLAVVAIVVMPVISITLATVRPESERQASQAIDAVNAYNDLLRNGNSPCDPAFAPESGGAP